jgi:hypothetical protein
VPDAKHLAGDALLETVRAERAADHGERAKNGADTEESGLRRRHGLRKGRAPFKLDVRPWD